MENHSALREWLPWIIALNVAVLVTDLFIHISFLVWAVLAITTLFVLAPRMPRTLRLPAKALTVAIIGLSILSALDADLLPVVRL